MIFCLVRRVYTNLWFKKKHDVCNLVCCMYVCICCFITYQYILMQELKSYGIILNIVMQSSDYYLVYLITWIIQFLSWYRPPERFRALRSHSVHTNHEISQAIWWFPVVWRERMRVWFSLQTCPPECCQM